MVIEKSKGYEQCDVCCKKIVKGEKMFVGLGWDDYANNRYICKKCIRKIQGGIENETKQRE